MKLNMGCGTDIKKGFLNVDCRKDIGVDKVMDLDKLPLRFKTNQFSYIYAYNFLEHSKIMLLEPIKFMEELWRITKHGGVIEAEVPFGTLVWGQLDHKKGFTYSTFHLLDVNNPDRHTDSLARFKVSFTTKPGVLGRFIPNFWIPGSTYGLRDTLALIFGMVNDRIVFKLQVVKW